MTDSPLARACWVEPNNFDQAWRLAELVVNSGLTPKGVNCPQDALLIIATGAELGMSPMKSLQQIHIVNRKPCLSASAMVALCKRSPLCEYFRTVESTDRLCTVETKRVGDPEASRHTFTIEMAKRAGLPARNGTWNAYPHAMLYAAASRELARREYPDLIGAFYEAEEIPPERLPEPTQLRVVSQPAESPSPAALEAQRGADEFTTTAREWSARLVEAGAAESYGVARQLLWERALRDVDTGQRPDAQDMAAAGQSLLLDHEQGTHLGSVVDAEVVPEDQSTPEQLGDGRADSPMTAAINVLMSTCGCTDLEAEQFIVTAQERLGVDDVGPAVVDRAIELAQAATAAA